MKEFLRDTFGTTLGLIGVLVFLQYYNSGYVNLKTTLSDGRNWIILFGIVAVSFGIKVYRRRNRVITKDL